MPVGDMVSPHTRGWTRHINQQLMECKGFPAHAGMDPIRLMRPIIAIGFPRTRGDGPAPKKLPAFCKAVSPHTRGWTPPADQHGHVAGGFPAHAGMDPYRGAETGSSRGFPRTRGDGPVYRPSAGRIQ